MHSDVIMLHIDRQQYQEQESIYTGASEYSVGTRNNITFIMVV
jgi:hypothetical protein